MRKHSYLSRYIWRFKDVWKVITQDYSMLGKYTLGGMVIFQAVFIAFYFTFILKDDDER